MTKPGEIPEGNRARITLTSGKSFKCFIGANKPDDSMMWVNRGCFNEPVEYSDIADITVLGDGRLPS